MNKRRSLRRSLKELISLFSREEEVAAIKGAAAVGNLRERAARRPHCLHVHRRSRKKVGVSFSYVSGNCLAGVVLGEESLFPCPLSANTNDHDSDPGVVCCQIGPFEVVVSEEDLVAEAGDDRPQERNVGTLTDG